jgi:hypothetical protein
LNKTALILAAWGLAMVFVAETRAAQPKKKDEERTARADREKRDPDGKAVAAKLRAEWDVGNTRMMRLVVDEAKFSPELKASLGKSIDKFLDQQDALLNQVEKDPSYEPTARTKWASLNADFLKTMDGVYKDEAVKKEFTRRLRAMDKEIDDIAAGADQLFKSLDSVGLSKDQREKLKPVLQDANTKVKGEVDKSETRTARDRKARDKIVKQYKDAHKAIRATLTDDQQEKLTKKLAGE